MWTHHHIDQNQNNSRERLITDIVMSFNDFGSARSSNEVRGASKTAITGPGSGSLDQDIRSIGEMLARFQVIGICNMSLPLLTWILLKVEL